MDEPKLGEASSSSNIPTSSYFSPKLKSSSSTYHDKPWTGSVDPATGKSTTRIPRSPATPRTRSGPVPNPIPVTKPIKTRRGKRNSKKYCDNLTEKSFNILHANIRGYSSKQLSFKSIYQRLNPNVITINEVGYKKDKKLSLPEYSSYTKNRKVKSMGGVATSIRKDEAGFALLISEGKDDDSEFLITRHAQFITPINIINYYGEQEGRSSNADIEDRWNVILENISNIERTGEEIIFIGDTNKLIGDGKNGVKNNNLKVSFGGKLIHTLLETGKFILLNNSEKCTGGPFTRVDPSNPSLKSCLDLCIISKGLEKYFVQMIIDEKRLFTPHRAIRSKLTYSDHF